MAASLGSWANGIDPRDEEGQSTQRSTGQQVLGAVTGVDAFSDINAMRNPPKNTYQADVYDPGQASYQIGDKYSAQLASAINAARVQQAPKVQAPVAAGVAPIAEAQKISALRYGGAQSVASQFDAPAAISAERIAAASGNASQVGSAAQMQASSGSAATSLAAQQAAVRDIEAAQRGQAQARSARVGPAAQMTAAAIDQGETSSWAATQASLADTLRARAAGQSTSVAEEQLKAGLSRAVSQQAAQRASARGISAGLAGRQQSQGTAIAQAQTNQAAAQLRAQEQAQAEQALGAVASSARGQAASTAEAQAALAQQAAQTNVANLQQTTLQQAANQQQVNLANAGFTQEALGQNAAMQQQAGIANQQTDLSTSQMNAQLAQQTALANAENQQAMALANTGYQNEAARTNAAMQQQVALANAENSQAMSLANAQLQQQAALANQQAGLTVAQQNQGVALSAAQQNAQLQQQTALANAANQQQASQAYAEQYLAAQNANQQAALQRNTTNANLATQNIQFNAGLAQQAALANQQATLQNNAQINNAVQSYLAMGMSREQAQQQAYADYNQLLAQQRTSAQGINANIATQNVETQQKANAGIIGAAGSVLGAVFSDERMKTDKKPIAQKDFDEFMSAVKSRATPEEEAAARDRAAIATTPFDARIAARMTPAQAAKFRGFSTLLASTRDSMGGGGESASPAPVAQAGSRNTEEDERIRRLLEAYTASQVLYRRTPETDASYARVPKDWSLPPGSQGYPVGFDRSKLKPGDLDSPPQWPSARAESSQMLDRLDPQSFRYRDPRVGAGENFGVMAQDLERSKIGRSLVEEDPWGRKTVNTDRGFGAVLAAQANLNERLRALEALRKA